MNDFGTKNTLSKAERISLQSRIDLLFTRGESFIAYPLRIVFTIRDRNGKDPCVSILTSVSKRKFKRAVKRNRVKRLIKENYRLNKALFHTIANEKGIFIDLAFLYLKDELPEYDEIEKSIFKTATLLSEKIVTKKEDEKNNT